MLRSGITITSTPLAVSQIEENKEIILKLFNDKSSNHSFVFNKLPQLVFSREGNHSRHINLGEIKLSDDYVTVLSAFLTQHQIHLKKEILQNNDKALACKQRLFQFFRAILIREAYIADAKAVQASLLSDDIKHEVAEKKDRVIASTNQTINHFKAESKRQESMLVANVAGDGGCFYHATTINLIYQIFSDEITDDTLTGKSIREKLLPLIAVRLAKLGGPQLDFSDVSLKDAFLKILQAAPLAILQEGSRPRIAQTINNDDYLRAINECDFYHLQRDIFEPTLRELITDASQTTKQAMAKKAFEEQLQTAFISHIKDCYGKELNFDENDILQARNNQVNDEVHDLPDYVKGFLLSSWNETFNNFKKSQTFKSVANEAFSDKKNELLVVLYQQWLATGDNAEHIFQTFLNCHAPDYKDLKGKPLSMMAGVPQQAVLSAELNCNLVGLEANTGQYYPLVPAREGTANLFYCSNEHYDAVVGNPEALPNTYAEALQARASLTNHLDSGLRTTVYPWAETVKEEPAKEEVAQTIPLTSLPFILQAVKSSKETHEMIDAQLATIDYSNVKPNMQKHAKKVIAAAHTGYRAALQHTTFGKTLTSVQQLTTISISEKAQNEAKDFALAVEEQNKEIEAYLSERQRPK